MMVQEPHKWVKPMKDAGANIYTFHIEASNNPQQLIKEVCNLWLILFGLEVFVILFGLEESS